MLCIAIDGTIVLWLAAKNATLTQNAWDLLGTALLLAIGITCALAIGVIVKYRHSSVLTPWPARYSSSVLPPMSGCSTCVVPQAR
ncbi:hypothetical protein R2325_12790 [Mycobacteroides chelonae]|nr:hypothetical protein [Mycobacteroides chelonae]MEC4872916.1 hypothetical protein [Mycobacteroides chelonae]MEC4901802.1 hypothetical protein [Mycobacteroides chelonae]